MVVMKRRLGTTLLAFIATLLTMFSIVPWVLTIVSVPLIVVWVGIPMLLGANVLMRGWVRPWRAWGGWARENPIVVPYRAFPGGGWFARLRWVITDPATWRELVWGLVNITAGFVLCLLPTVFLLGTVFYLIYPFLMYVTPPGVFTNPFGLFELTSWQQGIFLWPAAGVLFALWWSTTPGLMRGWGQIHSALLGPSHAAVLAGRVAALAASRADTVDSAAREVRRIERDLHDGVQVRLVSLGMSLGMAAELMDRDPERARALIDEATAATSGTLQDLRRLVRGIHPPVLADRGLVGAVRALALDAPLETAVEITGFGDDDTVRLDAPVEACMYFAVAEGLANAIKYAAATRILISLDLREDRLQVLVIDDGLGGAKVTEGGGLAGIQRRLAAFDGILDVASPTSGPTQLTMEIPCEPLSPKTTPSSVRA